MLLSNTLLLVLRRQELTASDIGKTMLMSNIRLLVVMRQELTTAYIDKTMLLSNKVKPVLSGHPKGRTKKVA